MSYVIADPQAIEAFRTSLVRYRDEVENELHDIQAKLARLEQSWRDQEYDKFASEFRQETYKFQTFLAVAEARIAELGRKIDLLFRYSGY